METQRPHVNAIIKMLSEQDSLLRDFDKKIRELTTEISDLKASKDLTEQISSQLKEQLASLGVRYPLAITRHIQTDLSDNNPSNHSESSTQLELSKNYTFEILKSLDTPAGITVQEIREEYEGAGLHTHDRVISGHLTDLIAENRIYQVNPENKRGRKYKIR